MCVASFAQTADRWRNFLGQAFLEAQHLVVYVGFFEKQAWR
jgi:hypothetical protein